MSDLALGNYLARLRLNDLRCAIQPIIKRHKRANGPSLLFHIRQDDRALLYLVLCFSS